MSAVIIINQYVLLSENVKILKDLIYLFFHFEYFLKIISSYTHLLMTKINLRDNLLSVSQLLHVHENHDFINILKNVYPSFLYFLQYI